MSEEEVKDNDSLKIDLLEQQVHDVVTEFESLKILNQEYINTNERLNNEIKNLKELNEQQVILNDNMLDSNKEIFKGSKRNIFWLVTIFALAAILLSFKLIDQRIDSKISGKTQNAIEKINGNIRTSSDSLAISKKLQLQIQNDTNNYKNIKKSQNEQLKEAQKEFQKTLNKFKTTTDGTNEAIKTIRDDYSNALKNFKLLLTEKETEIKELKTKFNTELVKISELNKKQFITTKTIQKAISKKQTKPKTAYSLLQKAFKYQKKLQYTNAIKMYREVLKINPKKDIAYYNLGIIYGNQKKYTQAIQAYKKSLDLNPKRNLTFTNIFEIQLITNKVFDSHILKLYKDYHKDKKRSLIKYEMLDIFRDVKIHKNIDKKLNNWKKDYAKVSLGSWSFTMLENWISKEKDKITKSNLNLILKTFKAHK